MDTQISFDREKDLHDDRALSYGLSFTLLRRIHIQDCVRVFIHFAVLIDPIASGVAYVYIYHIVQTNSPRNNISVDLLSDNKIINTSII